MLHQSIKPPARIMPEAALGYRLAAHEALGIIQTEMRQLAATIIAAKKTGLDIVGEKARTRLLGLAAARAEMRRHFKLVLA